MDALLTVSEMAELNRWFDSMVQDAPEGVQMSDLLTKDQLDGIKTRWFDFRDVGPTWGPRAWSIRDVGLLLAHIETLTDTAASEPQPNAATKWVSKTPAEARDEFEEGWQQAEAERVAETPPKVDDASRDALCTTFASAYETIQQQAAEIERLQAELVRLKKVETLNRILEHDAEVHEAQYLLERENSKLLSHTLMHAAPNAWNAIKDTLNQSNNEHDKVYCEVSKRFMRLVEVEAELATERTISAAAITDLTAAQAALKPFADVYAVWLERNGSGDYKTWLRSHYETTISYPREWYKKAHDAISK